LFWGFCYWAIEIAATQNLVRRRGLNDQAIEIAATQNKVRLRGLNDQAGFGNQFLSLIEEYNLLIAEDVL